MKKRIFSIFLVLALCLTLMPTMAWATEHTHAEGVLGHDITGWEGITTLPNTAGSYYLTADVTLSETWSVPTGDPVNLCLNGHVIKMTGSGSVIKVPQYATLNLYDCETRNDDTDYTHEGYIDTNGLWRLGTGEGTAETVTGGVITGGNNTSHGGGVLVKGTFNMNGGNIIGNTAQYGGGVDDNGAFNMYGGAITNNYAEQLGGGINLNGTFNMSGGEITKNNTASAKNGGGVYVNDGTFTMDGGKIADNNVNNGYGAGVYVNSNANFTMTDDSVISGNTGDQGAGVYSKGTFTMSGDSRIAENAGTLGGGVYVAGGTFTMNDGTISQNTASCYNDAGGGVYIGSGSFTMEKGAISGNNASGHGGGVHVCFGASFSLEDGQIKNNTAGRWAGGVCNKGTFKMTGGTISQNAANDGGGGGVSSGGEAIITGGTITQNTATANGGGFYNGDAAVTLGGTAKITGNTAGSGAKTANNLYLESGKTVTLASSPNDPKASMSVGVTLGSTGGTGEFVTTGGTAVNAKYFFSDASDKSVVFKSNTLNIAAGHIHNNITFEAWNDTNSLPTTSGSWYLTNDVTFNNSRWEIPNDQTINLCLNGHVITLNGTGGGNNNISINLGATLNLYDCGTMTVHKFNVNDSTGLWTLDETSGTKIVTGGVITGGINGIGGAIYLSWSNAAGATGATLNMYGGNIVGNQSASTTQGGGAVFVDRPSTFNMYGGKIIGNTAQKGGAVYIYNSATKHGTFNMSGGEIRDNKATEFGGGVYVSSDAVFNMSGGTISDCSATKGGGVFTWGNMTMTGNSAIRNCTVTIDGGGVCACNCAVTMNDSSKVSDCTAGNGAGGVYIWADSNKTASFTMNGSSTISDCEASANNSNRRSGGGVCVEGTECTFTMNGSSSICRSSATGGTNGVGGGVHVFSGTFNMNSGSIASNTADHGGGIHVADGAQVNITNGTIEDNCSEESGGGAQVDGVLIMSGGAIQNNHAKNDGGGVSVNGSTGYAKLTGTAKISDNMAQNFGGGVSYYNSSNKVTLGGLVQITGNKGGCTVAGDTFSGGTTQNVYLFNNNIIAIGTGDDAPTTGMSVGVTTKTAPTDSHPVAISSNGTAGDAKYFFSDNADYYVDFDTSVLKLKAPVAGNHAVNVIPSANGTVTASPKEAAQSTNITLTVTPASGYQLKADSLKASYSSNNTCELVGTGNTYTFKMPAYAVTVSTEFEKIPAPSGGGSSTPTVNVPVSGDKDSVKVTATVSGGNATVKNVTAEQLDKVGTGENVTIDLSSLSKSVSGVTIPKTTLENVAASEADGLEVKLPNGTTAVFDSTTVAAVAEQAAGSNIQLVVDKENKAEQALTAAQKETVKALNDALVLDAYFVSNGKRISDFKGGEAELTVSYPTTKPVRVWYVAEDGTKELVPSTFDGKAAKFVVTHFSHYAIEILDGSSYTSCPQDNTCVYAKFTDANTAAWYHDGVHYCVENGMMNGVSNTQFAPNGTLTRGMVVTVLARLDGVTITSTGSEWYADGQEWAVANGISDGTNMTGNITREQLATMLYRYALLKGVDTNKFTKDTNTLSHNDVFTISDWATSGMHFCIAAGVVNGDDKGNLNPHSTATRAEAATMFQRFCEKVIK